MKSLLIKKYNLLAIICILVMFLFLLATDFYFTWQIFNQHLLRDTQNGAIYAEETVGQTLSVLAALSKAPVLRTKDSAKIANFLNDIGNFPQLSSLELASPDGVRWAGKNRNIDKVDVKKSEFYQGVIKTGRPYVSGAHKSRVSGKIEFIVGYPIYDQKHRLENIFYAPVWSSNFSTILSKVKLESGGILHVIDSKGFFLLSSDTKINQLKFFDLSNQHNISESIFSILRDSGGKISAQQKINGTSWTIIVDRNISEVISTVLYKILYDILFVILVLLPVILAFLLFIAQINQQRNDLININKKLQDLAITDGLTGLLNHRAFQDTLSWNLDAASADKPLTLIMMDIDNFKIFNDQYGHLVGDKILKHLGCQLTEFFKQTGFVARYGGEEFVVVLPNTNPEKGLAMAQSLSELILSSAIPVNENQTAGISISIGVASYPKDASDRENLIRFADLALYRAKEKESNKVQMYYSVLEELRDNIKCDQDLMKIINTLNTIINAKDKYTYGHSERVMNYAVRLASQMGLPQEDIDNITIGAFLHDIGKIEIGGDILNKTGKLTPEEFEHIKKHPLIGVEIIKPVKSLEKALPFALYHHERYDGAGYPFGLAGKNIPLHGRIAAVVDAFDAMTTNRPYQKTKTEAEALEEIIRCSGTQFDPEVVSHFLALYKTHDKVDGTVSNDLGQVN